MSFTGAASRRGLARFDRLRVEDGRILFEPPPERGEFRPALAIGDFVIIKPSRNSDDERVGQG
mgnify:CR=1 FL=1